MPARIAAYFGPDTGCSTFPIGAPEDVSNPQAPVPLAAPAEDKVIMSGGIPGSEGGTVPPPTPLAEPWALRAKVQLMKAQALLV